VCVNQGVKVAKDNRGRESKSGTFAAPGKDTRLGGHRIKRGTGENTHEENRRDNCDTHAGESLSRSSSRQTAGRELL